MSKSLTESGLKAVLAKNKVKDNGLGRALGAYEKAGEEEHDAGLEALGQVGKLAAALKKNKEVAGNKTVVEYLEEVIDAADGREKALTKAKADAAKTTATEKKAQKEKEKEEEDDDDGEEEEEEEEDGAYGERLLTAFRKLKTLNGKPLAFIVCDARPYPAIMVAKRISSKQKEELTEITGGSRKFLKKGACYFKDDHYVLELEQAVPGLARKVQKSVKTHTGKKLKFTHGGETAGDDDEEESERPPEEPGVDPKVAGPQPGIPPAESVAPPTPQEMEVLEDRRRAFKKARAAWVTVKTQAEEDLEKVKDGAHEHYLADASQFPKIVQGCKDIDAIMDNLDDELRDTLDQYASTPLKNQAKLKALATAALEVLSRYGKYVENNSVLKAIDLQEFAEVTIHAPLVKALNDLSKALR